MRNLRQCLRKTWCYIRGGGDGEAKIWVGNSRPLAIYGSRLEYHVRLEFHVPRPGFLVTHRLFDDIMAAEKLFRGVYGYCVCTRTDVQVTELAPVWPDPHICVCIRTDVQDTELAPVWQDPHIVLDNALHVGQNCRQHRHRSGEIIDGLVWSPDAASTGALFVVDGLVHTVVTPALTSAIVAGALGSMRDGKCVLHIGLFQLNKLHWAFYRNFNEAVCDSMKGLEDCEGREGRLEDS